MCIRDRLKNVNQILVFRKFHHDNSSKGIRKIVRKNLGKFGHVFTLADSKIKVSWYVKLPMLIGQTSLFHFRQRKISNTKDLDKFKEVIKKKGWLNVNWLLSATKIFPVRTSDDYWEETVLLLLEKVELILFDLSQITEAIEWELERIAKMGLFKKVVFIAPQEVIPHAKNYQEKYSILFRKNIPLFFINKKNQLVDPALFEKIVSEKLAYNYSKKDQINDSYLKRGLSISCFFLLILMAGVFFLSPILFPSQIGKYSIIPDQVYTSFLVSTWRSDNQLNSDFIAERGKSLWSKKMTEKSISSAKSHHISECEAVVKALNVFHDSLYLEEYINLIENGEPVISEEVFNRNFNLLMANEKEFGFQFLGNNSFDVKKNGLKLLTPLDLSRTELEGLFLKVKEGYSKTIYRKNQHLSVGLSDAILAIPNIFVKDKKKIDDSLVIFNSLYFIMHKNLCELDNHWLKSNFETETNNQAL